MAAVTSRASRIAPAQVPARTPPARVERAQRVEPGLVAHQVEQRRALAARDHQAREAVEPGDAAHLAHVDAEVAGRRRRAPRSRPAARARRTAASPAAGREPLRLGQLRRSRGPRIASPSPRETSATTLARPASAWSRARSRSRARAGSSDLKMPEPTNTASAPSAITARRRRASRCRRRRSCGTGSLPVCATRRTSSYGAPSFFASAISSSGWSSVSRRIARHHCAQVAHGLDDVAGAGLALGADHAPRPRRSGAAPRRGRGSRRRTGP